MHRSVLTLAATALIVVGCDSSPFAPEQPTAGPSLARDGRPDHENVRAPFAQTVANPCPPVPEPVAVEGYSHYNAQLKFFEGGNEARLKGSVHASGIGAVTGVGYQFHELFTLHGIYTYANSRWETERSTRFHVISQTGLGNFFSTVKENVVCTPEGCQGEVVSIDTDCRG